MNLQTYQQCLGDRNYRVIGKAAYGVENDYPAAVFFVGAKQWRIALTAVIDNFKEVRKSLKEQLGKKYGFQYANNHLTYDIIVTNKDYQETLNEALTEVTRALHQMGIKPSAVCPICGQSNCNVLVSYANGYDPAHKSCLDQMANHVRTKAEKSTQSGNYITGIIGALLGAVIGALPSVLSIIWVERIYAILFALIPLASYYGYKLLKGKMTTAVIPITIVFSIVGVYVIEIVLLIYYMIWEYGLTFGEAFPLTMASLTDPSIWVAMTMDSITSFIFVALGIWIAWGRISRTAKTEVQDLDSVMASVMMYGEDPSLGYTAATEEADGSL